MSELAVVTGAFGYTGRHITARLLDRGVRVRTLTGHPDDRNTFDAPVETFPFNFDFPEALVESLRGARTLYNTYWVRFPRGEVSFERAVRNSVRLFEAAATAGVERIVHISITNPYDAPHLPYFAGKAAVEGALLSCNVPAAIVRPTVLFGGGDVFINNIAWLLRRFPFFPIPGPGNYRLQPVHVGDVASICVDAAERDHQEIIDAAGPEIFAFEDLVRLTRDAIGSRAKLLHAPPRLSLWLARAAGTLSRDVLLTRGELVGLMAELIVSKQPPEGRTRFTEWLSEHAAELGTRYASELARHYRADWRRLPAEVAH